MGKLRIRARLGTCGRCGGRLGNPLTHVCVTRAGRPRRRTKTRIRPRVSVAVKCKTCGKRFEIPSHRALIFLEELEGLPQDVEDEEE